jgi:branched-chain amino acid transport system permease protein
MKVGKDLWGPTKRLQYTVAIGVFAVLAAVPFFGTGYIVRFLTFVFMWVILTQSLNMVTGYAGYLDFGHVVFFGIGAYVTGVLMVREGTPFILALFTGAAVATGTAVVVGLPTMRLRGAYFAIAMLVFAEAIKQIVLELKEVTGGGLGLSLPVYANYTFFYYVMYLVMTCSIAAVYWIEKSKIGYALKAIKGSEITAEVSGVDTLKYKIAAFSLSAFFAGLAGGIYAYWMTFIYPYHTFSVLMTVQMVIMLFLGGAGTVLGPILGSVILSVLSEILWAKFIYLYLIILGVMIVAIVLIFPEGVLGLIEKRLKRGKA